MFSFYNPMHITEDCLKEFSLHISLGIPKRLHAARLKKETPSQTQDAVDHNQMCFSAQ